MWQARCEFKVRPQRRFVSPTIDPHAADPAPVAPPSGYRGRFAPSPTGDLHAGSLLAAFGSWLLARAAGGEWWVRIEDLDPPREVAGAAERQLDALTTFGLHPDAPVVRQSGRDALYQQAVDRLLADGRAFTCHCSRTDLFASGGIHRQCVARIRRPRPAIRLRVEDGCRIEFVDAVLGPQSQDIATEVGDFVLKRADGCWAYQLAVVVDDAAQGITDVVRGADLLDSTPRQILLQRALGLATPRYAHLPLVTDATGNKLSKSDAAHPLDSTNPLPALRQAWRALGQDPAALEQAASVPGLLAAARDGFDPQRIPKAAMSAASHNTVFTIPD